MSYNSDFMQRAIALSELAFKSGRGLPIGCVIVKDGSIVGEGHNEIFSRNNPTAHAEMVAIENACSNSGSLQLDGCELYTSLEPCPMCFGAVYWAGVKTVYFAATGADAAKAGFADNFIAAEFNKPRQLQRIPMHHRSDPGSLRVLKDWKLLNPDVSQIPGDQEP